MDYISLKHPIDRLIYLFLLQAIARNIVVMHIVKLYMHMHKSYSTVLHIQSEYLVWHTLNLLVAVAPAPADFCEKRGFLSNLWYIVTYLFLKWAANSSLSLGNRLLGFLQCRKSIQKLSNHLTGGILSSYYINIMSRKKYCQDSSFRHMGP